MNIMHALVMPMPKVQPADKLHVGKFIPKHLSDKVRTAKTIKVWKPDEVLSFVGLPAGSYYLKANHGSLQNLRIEIPCSDEELLHVRQEVALWMSESYGLKSCQWWYRFISAHVFLQEDLSADLDGAPIEDFRFRVINGKAAVRQLDVGHNTDARHNPVCDNNLNDMPHAFLRKKTREEPRPALTQDAQDFAIKLGKQFQYFRVDYTSKAMLSTSAN